MQGHFCFIKSPIFEWLPEVDVKPSVGFLMKLARAGPIVNKPRFFSFFYFVQRSHYAVERGGRQKCTVIADPQHKHGSVSYCAEGEEQCLCCRPAITVHFCLPPLSTA